MSKFDSYKNAFPNARLTRSPSGVLEVALHTDGGKLVFNGHTHEQFVDLFHQIGADTENRVVILTGSGDAFCAGMLYGLHEGLDVDRCLKLGMALAHFNLFAASATDGAVPLARLDALIDTART